MRIGKSAAAGLFVLLALWSAKPALAAPVARMTVTPIQNPTTQVAPCAYHFDATASNSTGFTRPFHTLTYQWDFGDPDSGYWSQGAAARDNVTWARNYDIGAVAGHVYTKPGPYVVTLTVTDPSGKSDQITSNLTCTAPEAHFPASASYCFADISGKGGDWTGCPANSKRTDTTDLDAAINKICGAETMPGRHCSFRKGDSFTLDNAVTLRSNGTSPGLVDTFGNGAKPIVRIVGKPDAAILLGDQWTFAGFEMHGNPACLDTPGCGFANSTPASNSTLYDVSIDNVLRCYGQGVHNPDLTAIVNVDCTLNATSNNDAPSSVFLSGPRILFMGNNIDTNYIPGGEFNFRYSTNKGGHGDKTVIAHSRFQHAPIWRTPIQIRGEHRYIQIHDNHLSTQNARSFLILCEYAGGCDHQDSNEQDLMFEMNFATIEAGATVSSNGGQSKLLQVEASDWTVRNNIFDLQGAAIAANQLTLCLQNVGFETNVNGACLNNTIYLDDATSDGMMLFDGCDIGSGHRVEGNLIYAPNMKGARTITSSNGCTAEANLYATTNPFKSTPPDRGDTRPSDFQLRSGSVAIGAGPNYSNETDHFVAFDAYRDCRTRNGVQLWDIGAAQFNAESCGAGSLVVLPALTAPVFLP